MVPRLRSLCRFACFGLCAATLLAGPAGDRDMPQVDSAYYRGQPVSFHVVHGPRTAEVGPWLYGVRLRDSRPHDRRLNLYLVFPGSEHRARGWEGYDHNCIISALPESDEPAEWDVYWAVVLDPSLTRDLRDERNLILAAQSSFVAPDLFEFDDVPAGKFLRAGLKIHSLTDLARFRHKDGSWPRVILVPAGFAIQASAEPPVRPASADNLPRRYSDDPHDRR